jgi:hypothetical protein
MKKTMLCLVIAATGGCASRQAAPVPASAFEKESALKDYMNCLVPYAKRLDDGVSDARTIASGMVGACQQEFEYVFDTTTRADNGAVKQTLRHHQSQMQANTALTVVLSTRAAARNATLKN